MPNPTRFTRRTGRPVPILLALILACLAFSDQSIAGDAAAPPTPRRPNLVLILTDNHGAWTLGCYGNKDVRTPHIDRLAAEGVRFTRALASNPVCSPTRATLLTGLLPSQHGVHSYLTAEKNGVQMGPNAHSTIREFTTLPKVLRDAGYVCGLSGKWHLGGNLHPQEGFSSWITMPHGHTTEFYDVDVIEDGKVRKEPKYLTDLWTERAVTFIEQNRERPFFLYLAYNGPYGLGQMLRNPARNRHAEHYADQPLLSFPRDAMHPWLRGNKPFLNNLGAIRRTAAEISGVDDGVGAVMDALRKQGLDENTLVVFTADQGWMGGQNGIWGMGDHTRPAGAFDLMMQVPLIFRHPGKVTTGATSDLLVSNYDLMPTVLSYLGLGDRMGGRPESPGRDFSPVLSGKEAAGREDDAVYYEMEDTRAVRTDGWKYVARRPEGPHELYDLKADPHERFNLYGQPRHRQTQEELERRLGTFFQRYADPQYDLWRGGRSKAKRLGGGAG